MDLTREIALIIPTLNEAPAIKQVLDAIPPSIDELKVAPLVIDGGSSDDTQKIVERAKVPIIRQQGSGKGSAMIEAVADTRAEILCFIDGDNTYPLEELPKLIEPLLKNNAEMVIGSRILGRREPGAISALNTLGNRVFNAMTNFALKSKITDLLSGYRAMRRETFDMLFLSTRGFEIEAEMTIEAIATGLRVVEVPIEYRKRTAAASTKLHPIQDGYRIFKVLILILLATRPMLFFGIASIAIFLIGLYPALIVVYEKLAFGSIIHIPSVIFAGMLWLFAAILFVLGILSQLVIVTRRRIERLFLQSRTRY